MGVVRLLFLKIQKLMEKCELQVGSFFIPFVELTSNYVYIVVWNHPRIFCPSCGMWYSSEGSHYFCSTISVKYKGILYPSISARLVLYNTVHKGTSKHQKNDEKHPFCVARFSIYNWIFISPLHPKTIQKWSGIYMF